MIESAIEIGVVYSVTKEDRDIENGSMLVKFGASLIALAIISLLTSTTLISLIVELFVRLFNTTFMLIRSLASINSVTCAAVCAAKVCPRMSAC